LVAGLETELRLEEVTPVTIPRLSEDCAVALFPRFTSPLDIANAGVEAKHPFPRETMEAEGTGKASMFRILRATGTGQLKIVRFIR
jgi:hypothetical protein